MIKKIIRSYVVNVLALYLVSVFVGGFHLSQGWTSLLEVGAGFTAIHLLLRPILGFITGPLNFLTLGLIGLVIDAALLYLLTLFFPEVYITGWFFPGLTFAQLSIDPMQMNILTVTILCAFIINLIRSVIIGLCE
jgi:putative membrane protein